MASRIFSIGRIVKAATAAVVAMAVVFPWLSPAVSRAEESAKPAAAGVWAESFATNGKPADMGKNAGIKLKEACKGRKPDLVLLFDFKYAIKTPEEKKAILDGVAESFDRKIICGSTIHGPLLTGTVPSGSVGVLALGGVKAMPVKVAPEKGKEEAAYTTLAESLKAPYAEAAGKGRLVLLFGACVPPGNSEKIVNAFTTTLGKDVFLFGSPAPEEGFQYYQGELLNGHLMAILVTGDFTCRFAMADASPARKGDQGQDPDKIVKSAGDVMKAAGGDKTENAALIFVTHCFTRNHSMANGKEKRPTGFQDEYRALTQGVAAPLFGVMDDIEIGHPATGEPAVARADQINVCVISQQKK